MVRRDIRSAALLATARVTGRRWDVAMREAEWERFLSEVDVDARLRLAAVMRRFCDHGDRDLPGSAFRWLTRPGGAAREASFEARGTVLRCHATDRVMFVDAVDIDPDAPVPRRARRPRRGPHAPQLALPLPTPTETSHGRDR